MLKRAAFLTALAMTNTSLAQQTLPASKQQARVMHKAQSLMPNSPIRVVQFHAEEEFGKFLSCDEQGITLFDVDRRKDVTIAFSEISKIRNGYGGYNSLFREDTPTTRKPLSLW